jgi:hypothetical protein
MQGWFNLIEKLRRSGSSTNESIRSLPNSNLNNNRLNTISSKQQNSFDKSLPNTTNTNGHTLRSSETINTPDSPPNIFNSPSIISIASTPRQIINDLSFMEAESTPTSRLRRGSIPIIDIGSPTVTSSSSPSNGINILFNIYITQNLCLKS